MEEQMKEKEVLYQKAPFMKRIAAWVIDAIVAFVPVLLMYWLFTGTYEGLTILFYESPGIAAVSMSDLPGLVHESLNTFENPDGSTYTQYNASFFATTCRAASVFVIVFYVFYSTFCAYIFDGKTIGKKLMKLRMVVKDLPEKPQDEVQVKEWEKITYKRIFVREVLGKVVLNTIPIFPIISIFTILFTKQGLSIHDMMGKTCVIDETKNEY